MVANRAAAEVLKCIGGKRNVLANSLCMTRLRVMVANPTIVDRDALGSIEGVLGTTTRGSDGFEVVFGPRTVTEVFEAFAALTGLEPTIEVAPPAASFSPSRLSVQITSQNGSKPPSAAEMASVLDDILEDGTRSLDESESRELERMLLDSDKRADEAFAASGGESDETVVSGPRVLVINGPNINMLGIREPDIYGGECFSSLLELCKESARAEGFSECQCFQSNHEGDIVDVIQDAYQAYDGIIINPGAYTHTSIAILDALKAVSIPAIEVHISDVDDREDFRKVSYVRLACFETISGMGIEGYRKAMADLAAHLSEGRDD
ncbi:MAG: type II 3-dehydroquinate dehydratase [Olsenella sp.]|nr:type II 3-dehydroquinate dehydratase [Olsenella sp.]